VKRGAGTIPGDRTENRHRCPWVSSLRRAGVNGAEGTRQIGPVTSGEGVPVVLNRWSGASSPPAAGEGPRVAVTRGDRLFNKNAGPR
jgi:hypothetical protein